jgi:hypothetical protein
MQNSDETFKGDIALVNDKAMLGSAFEGISRIGYEPTHIVEDTKQIHKNRRASKLIYPSEAATYAYVETETRVRFPHPLP